MKWAFGIKRKISAALLLATIFVLIFAKNMVDNQNVTALGNSFSSVYKDRLMVESYIFRLSEHLFRKKIMIDSTAARTADISRVKGLVEDHNRAIAEIITEYEKTKLTEAEDRFFKAFRKNIHDLNVLEADYLQRLSDSQDATGVKDLISAEFNSASLNLGQLSSIQILEGKLMNEHSQKIVAGSSILTQFEMGILIAISLIIMVLVFESSSVFSKSAQNQSLN